MIQGKMFINKKISFDAPEGEFRLKITDAKLTKDNSGRKMFRFCGDLVSIKSRSTTFQAGNNYYGGEEELLAHLEAILGEEAYDVLDEDGKVREDRLDLFIGRECDVQIKHVRTSKHKNPFRKIVHLTAPGEMVKWPE